MRHRLVAGNRSFGTAYRSHLESRWDRQAVPKGLLYQLPTYAATEAWKLALLKTLWLQDIF